MITHTERHAALVDAGWTCRLDGKWRPPDRSDLRAYTSAAAWATYSEQQAAAVGQDRTEVR